jgi:hypothetical protein
MLSLKAAGSCLIHSAVVVRDSQPAGQQLGQACTGDTKDPSKPTVSDLPSITTVMPRSVMDPPGPLKFPDMSAYIIGAGGISQSEQIRMLLQHAVGIDRAQPGQLKYKQPIRRVHPEKSDV